MENSLTPPWFQIEISEGGSMSLLSPDTFPRDPYNVPVLPTTRARGRVATVHGGTGAFRLCGYRGGDLLSIAGIVDFFGGLRPP